ncbi:MAG: N-6 DNA methylase, partial [Anaerolineae bacterium]|nr:N-6 DNA methylase [Anaerolineae bacterium]
MSVGASRLLLDMHAVAVNEAVKPVKKDFGIFFTPEWVIDLMVGMIDKRIEEEGQAILEPACGVAQFLTGVKRNRPAFFHRTRRLGIEVNDNIIGYIRQEQIVKDVEIIQCDYLLWETDVRFDLIIGNPPYGIPSLSDHYTIRVDNETKRKYKESFSTWYGKYNVYGAFIEKSIRLLKEGGQLLFVVPATFILLDEFKKLREFLARHGETRLVYLGPDVFKPEADVATLVLDFKKSREAAHVIALLEYADGRVTPISKRDRWKGEIVIFGTPFTKRLEALCSYRLSDVYEIRVSPRTPEIKHNPWIKKEKQIDDDRYLPILNGRNLKNHRVIYEPATGYWIEKNRMAT